MRLIRARDIVDLIALATLFLIAGIVRERHWERVALYLAGLHARFLGFSGSHLGALADELLGISARELEIAYRQHSYLELIEILRDHWPNGWRPTLRLVGEEHVEAALARGKGIIFWHCTFSRSAVPFRMVTRQAGCPVSVLMADTHGFSDTKFGVRFLNPIRVIVERRYTRETCVIGDEGAGPAIRRLIQRLNENGCIMITAIQSGKHVSERSCLGGLLRLAKGGPSIAVSTGAALMPIFTVPVGPSSFEIHVEPPLTSEADDPEQRQEDMVSAYIPILERYVRKCPHLWRGWIGSPSYWRPN